MLLVVAPNSKRRPYRPRANLLSIVLIDRGVLAVLCL